ncbi:MAG UNVERIFIED_CONTAM: hypothetical protein LVR18_11765 [Planctomycetaceae bacterium]|jgi:hypothetical protein
MQDYAWLEDRIGPLVPIEVLLAVDADAALTDRGVLDLLWKLERRLRELPHVDATYSCAHSVS